MVFYLFPLVSLLALFLLKRKKRRIYCKNCKKDSLPAIKEKSSTKNLVLKYIKCPRCKEILAEWKERVNRKSEKEENLR